MVLGLFRRRDGKEMIESGLQRTKETWFSRITRLLEGQVIEEGVWDELDEVLVSSDVGVDTAGALIKSVRSQVDRGNIRDPAGVRAALKDEMVKLLVPPPSLEQDGFIGAGEPWVILVVGVNGTGKTTTIGKLAHYFKGQGLSTIIAAADTFRAAAVEQLQMLGQRVGAQVISHQSGADPGAVVFDALQAAKSRGSQVVIVDTAGRLHTKVNLMEELKKVHRVINRFDSSAPHQVLLVLDATTGQNGLTQAKAFADAVGVTGVVLTKLDGTAKGGIVFPISRQLGLPVLFVGTGEGLDDLVPFDPREFVDVIFS